MKYRVVRYTTTVETTDIDADDAEVALQYVNEAVWEINEGLSHGPSFEVLVEKGGPDEWDVVLTHYPDQS